MITYGLLLIHGQNICDALFSLLHKNSNAGTYCEYVYTRREFSSFQALTLASTILGSPQPECTASMVPSTHITLSYVMHEHSLGIACEGNLETAQPGGSYRMEEAKVKV